MKRISLITLVLLLFSATGWTQTEKNFDLYFSGGLSFPSKPQAFADYWKMGLNFGGGLGFDLSPSISIVGFVDYNNFAFDEKGLLQSIGLSGSGVLINGGSASIFTISGNLKILFNATPRVTTAYFIGGAGFFSVSTADVKVTYQGVSASVKGESESALSFHLGAGIEVPVGETTNIYVEGQYGIGLTKNESTNYIPVKLGVKLKI